MKEHLSVFKKTSECKCENFPDSLAPCNPGSQTSIPASFRLSLHKKCYAQSKLWLCHCTYTNNATMNVWRLKNNCFHLPFFHEKNKKIVKSFVKYKLSDFTKKIKVNWCYMKHWENSILFSPETFIYIIYKPFSHKT